MKKSQYIIMSAVIAAAVTPVFVSAQGVSGEAVPAAKTQTACEKVTQKIDDRIKSYDEKAKLHDARFMKLIETLTNISTRLKSRGQDTSALDAQIAELTVKREKLNQDKQAFLSKMDEAKSVGCSKTPGELKAKIGEAKTIQQTVVTDVKDFQTLTKTIRSAIASIRAQIMSAVATSTPAR